MMIILIEVMNSLTPVNFERSKQASVKRLCFMCHVRGEAQNDDIVLLCKSDSSFAHNESYAHQGEGGVGVR